MQFFTVTDQVSIKHKILIVPLNQKEMSQLVGQCEKCMPSIAVSSIVQVGHPYVVVDFSGGTWKTAIPLDEESEDGHKVGDELEMGDVLNVIFNIRRQSRKGVRREGVHERPPGERVGIQFPLHRGHSRELCPLQDD